MHFCCHVQILHQANFLSGFISIIFFPHIYVHFEFFRIKARRSCWWIESKFQGQKNLLQLIIFRVPKKIKLIKMLDANNFYCILHWNDRKQHNWKVCFTCKYCSRLYIKFRIFDTFGQGFCWFTVSVENLIYAVEKLCILRTL